MTKHSHNLLFNTIAALRADLTSVNSVIGQIENQTWGHLDERDQLTHDHCYEQLESLNRKIFLKLCLAADCAGSPHFAQEVRRSFRSREKINDVDLSDYSDCLYSPTTRILALFVDTLESAFSAMVGQNEQMTFELNRLEDILRGTAKMIFDDKVNPKNEAEVRSRVLARLSFLYPDTLREIPIAKIFKTYKPDIGIPSLKAAIEYKFADSEDELKSQIGAVYEDIHGYAGSSDWKHFFAVFYVTDAFITSAQLAAEFNMSDAPSSWRPILVMGKGARTRRASATALLPSPHCAS